MSHTAKLTGQSSTEEFIALLDGFHTTPSLYSNCKQYPFRLTGMAVQVRQDMLETIAPLLRRSGSRDYPVVLMTCGIAGSGKSTLAKAVINELPYFARLSIDEIIFEKHGLYGVDYPANDKLYQQYQEDADKIFVAMFRKLLEKDKDIVLDRSFYAKEDRKEYKHMIEDGGGKWVLVYLKAGSKEELWNRICERSAKRKEANSALEISRSVFETYWTDFEEPQGEGEVVIEVCHQPDTSTQHSSMP